MAQANQPTRRFGDFEIIERLGRGGFGTVYKARETTLGRIVALKVLNHAFANDPDWVRRFQREASIAANLNHTIIPVIYRFGDVNGRYFISMAFVPGVNLAQVSRHGGPMAVDRMVALLTPVAEALDYAHGQGVVHRDLKPGNIMVLPDDKVALMDYGLARLASVTGAGATVTNTLMTGAGATVANTQPNGAGTLPYLSPEQFRNETPGPASDRYALGVTAYELLTRRYPFENTDTRALKRIVLTNEPPSVRTLRPDVSERLANAVTRMLAKAPRDRFGTSVAFVQELAEANRPIVQVLSARTVATVVATPDAHVDVRNWTVVGGKLGGVDGAFGTAPGEFRYPSAIAVDVTGAVWVADSGNHRIQRLTPGGRWEVLPRTPAGGPSSYGIAAGQFDRPSGIAVDRTGAVWVCDRANHSIQLMIPGEAWQVIGGKTTGGLARNTPQGEFDNPSGIAVDGQGAVWVVETQIGRIQVRSPGGEWSVVAGKPRAEDHGIRTAAGQFQIPSAIAVDRAGTVWVSDTGNHRIQRRTVNGEWQVFSGKPGRGDYAKGNAPGEFFLPTGIAVDGFGAVWVADTENHRVQMCSPNGEWHVKGARDGDGESAKGTATGEFSSPTGVAIDETGAVWVADTGNHRIQRLGTN